MSSSSAGEKRFYPKDFLDKENFISLDHFYAYVWKHRLEIGAKLSAEQKAKFAAWIDFDNTPLTVGKAALLFSPGSNHPIGEIKLDATRSNNSVLVVHYYPTTTVTIEPSITEDNQLSRSIMFRKEFSISRPWEGKDISPVNSQDSGGRS